MEKTIRNSVTLADLDAPEYELSANELNSIRGGSPEPGSGSGDSGGGSEAFQEQLSKQQESFDKSNELNTKSSSERSQKGGGGGGKTPSSGGSNT